MKHPTAFRMTDNTLSIINMLSSELHISKTAVIEEAVSFYAQEKHKNKLLKYAGILSDEEANTLLETMYSSRHDKTLNDDTL